MTISNKFAFKTFTNFNKFVEERNLVAERLEKTFPEKKFRDQCLSFHGDQPCDLFYADTLRSVTYKCDPNNLTVYINVDGDD